MEKSYFIGVDKCLKPLLKKGVDEGVFSGVAVGMYKYSEKGNRKQVLCYGKTRKNSGAAQIKEATFFDLASLTKPLCTVQIILHLLEREKISWNTTLGAIFGTKTPEILKKIQITHLLSHSSGLKAYVPYYQVFKAAQYTENKERLLGFIFNDNLIYSIGKKCVYSDLGYILLGEIIERVSGEKLNDFFKKVITGPLGLEKQVMFRPVDTFATSDTVEIAATQHCPWRKRLLQGEVDDEHCWLMNGVAGHAGMFGTVNGVLDMATHILNQWQGREENPSYSNVLLQQALTRKYSDQTWCQGFDTPSPRNSSGGKYISMESVGHVDKPDSPNQGQ